MKTFARFDANGDLIPGSMINSTKKPVNGSWKEITDNKQCCNPYTEINYTINVTSALSAIYFRVYCNSGGKNIYHYTNATMSGDTINDLVDFCNEYFSYFGRFSTNGVTTVTLKLKKEIADSLNCDSYLMEIGED